MHILISVSVNENMSTESAIQKQCMQIAYKFMYASRMHVNCKQNECKLCAHTHVSKYLHVAHILLHACIWPKYWHVHTSKRLHAKYEFLHACMQFLSEILNSSSSIVIGE